MSDWPKYESHKIVQAARIVTLVPDGDGNCVGVMVDPGTGVEEEFHPSIAGMLENAEIGGWAMLYPDGYRSISPAKAFEEGYAPHEP